MSTTDNKIVTTTQQVEIEDFDSWLAAPGSDSVVLPTETKAPIKNVFSPQEKVNFDFLDQDDNKEEIVIQKEELDEDGNVKTEKVVQKAEEFLKELTGEGAEEESEEGEDTTEAAKAKGGRPKTEKSGLVEFLKKRIEEKEMVTFDDFDDETGNLDEYLTSLSEADIEELWKANMESIKTKVAVDTPKEFFDALPEELQYAAKYVMDGGQDLKSLFKALAHVEETRTLDPEAEDDQEDIVRGYLLATKFGSEEEINEEIEEWKNLGTLEKKAKQFKPKLDSMQEEQVAAQLAEQENRKVQQQQAAEAYVNNTFEALRTGELNGIKLDKKTQTALYTGLVKPQYPSMSGRPTNLLGHLLEKYQFGPDKNYGLIAEALYLLSSPDEYRENLIKTGKTAAVEDITRKLKTEANRKNTTTGHIPEEKPKSLKPQRQNNIFKR